AEPRLVAARRAALVESLRARGYDTIDAGKDAPGVPRLLLDVDGRLVDDTMMHAPDDERRHIVNDLHYHFVIYHVGVTVIDGDGALVARGTAEADRDP